MHIGRRLPLTPGALGRDSRYTLYDRVQDHNRLLSLAERERRDAMADSTLGDLDNLAARARRDTSIESLVLVAAGVLACFAVAVNLATSSGGYPDALHGVGSWSLALLIPLALVAIWLRLRRRESRRGVGLQSRTVGWTALWVSILFLLLGLGPILTFVLGPYPVLMGLVAIAGLRFSSRLLLGWGVVAGALGTWAGMYQFNNRFGLPTLDTALAVSIAVATLIAGIVVGVRQRNA